MWVRKPAEKCCRPGFRQTDDHSESLYQQTPHHRRRLQRHAPSAGTGQGSWSPGRHHCHPQNAYPCVGRNRTLYRRWNALSWKSQLSGRCSVLWSYRRPLCRKPAAPPYCKWNGYPCGNEKSYQRRSFCYVKLRYRCPAFPPFYLPGIWCCYQRKRACPHHSQRRRK